MSCAEFYEELTRKNPREISLRFGTEFEGRHPSNPVFKEFEDYISKATNLEDLIVNWDNTCALVTLHGLLNGIDRNPRSASTTFLREVKMADDERPLDTTNQVGFADVICSLGRRNASVKKFAFGHNNYGASNWIDFYSSNDGGSNFAIDDLVFAHVRAYETLLDEVLDRIAGETKGLTLCLSRHMKYLSRDGLGRIMNILETKCVSLTEIFLQLDPQSNGNLHSQPMAWPGGKPEYAFIIQSLAKIVKNNSDHLESIEIRLGSLSSVDDEETSKDLARAIKGCKHLKKIDMQAWGESSYAPWGMKKEIAVESDDECDY